VRAAVIVKLWYFVDCGAVEFAWHLHCTLWKHVKKEKSMTGKKSKFDMMWQHLNR